MQIKRTLARYAIKAASYLSPSMAAGMWATFGNPYKYAYFNDFTGYKNKIVYAAVNILLNKLTEVPQIVSVKKGKRPTDKFYSPSLSNEERKSFIVKNLTELEEHPLIDLLQQPNEFHTGLEMMEHFWLNYEFGDGFILPVFPGEESRKAGQPIALYSINKMRVTINQNGSNPYSQILSYTISLYNGQQLTVLPNQILHLKKVNPLDSEVTGFNPMEATGLTVSRNEENQTAQAAAFRNGGRGTLFSSDIGSDSTEGKYMKMPSEQMASLKETMLKDYAGSSNNRRMHFTNGYVNVQNFGDTLSDMEMIDAEKADWRDIFANWGVPVSLAPTGEALTDNNQAAAYKGLVTNNIVPKLRKFDQKFNSLCKDWYPQRITVFHDITEFKELAPDLKLLKEVYGDVPWLTLQEKRQLFNFDADEKRAKVLDKYYIQSGWTDLETMDFDMEPDNGTDLENL